MITNVKADFLKNKTRRNDIWRSEQERIDARNQGDIHYQTLSQSGMVFKNQARNTCEFVCERSEIILTIFVKFQMP